MTTYAEGLEDGLLLASLLLERHQSVRTPATHYSVVALRVASERLSLNRLRSVADTFAPLYAQVST